MSNLYRDPWAKNEAWRQHPVFSRTSMLRGLFPGFGIAVVAFTAYVVVDNLYLSVKKPDAEHKEHGHH
ncbi:NADH dehydrogenase 1 beta subcomplex subunit 3 [Mycena floridula]|nr:NADH dehydrogenase 1 beta subcomplex subunit 3 [Mycena floridula]